jgi:hypothetical protein
MSDFYDPGAAENTPPDNGTSWSDYPKAAEAGALDILAGVRAGISYLQDKAGNPDQAQYQALSSQLARKAGQDIQSSMTPAGQQALQGDWAAHPFRTLGMGSAGMGIEIVVVAAAAALFFGEKVRTIALRFANQAKVETQSLRGSAGMQWSALREKITEQWRATSLPIALLLGLSLIAAAIYFR